MGRRDREGAGVDERGDAAPLELPGLHEEAVQPLELHVDAHDADRGRDPALRDPAHVELGHTAERPLEVAAAQEVEVLIDEAGNDHLPARIDNVSAAERLGLRREAFADRENPLAGDQDFLSPQRLRREYLAPTDYREWFVVFSIDRRGHVEKPSGRR